MGLAGAARRATSLGVGGTAHLLVGALSHSGCWRGVLADAEDFPHLVEAIDAVLRRLGGLTRRWRFDRMATVCSPSSGRLTAGFAAVAEYYAVAVDVCPSRHGNHKGVRLWSAGICSPVAAVGRCGRTP